MSNIPKFEKPDVSFIKNEKFKVKTSQIPPMDVAFSQITLTDYELLVATIRKLNELIMMTNSYTEFIDEILKWVVNDGLEAAVLELLEEWLADGTLEQLINDTLFKMKLEKTEFYDWVETIYNVFVENTGQALEDLDAKKLDKIDFDTFINDNYEVYKRLTSEKFDELDGELVYNAQQSSEYLVNVKNPPFGLTPAKGDGITDDTDNINLIVEYVKNNRLGGIYFPNSSGEYMIRATSTDDSFPAGANGGGINISSSMKIILHPNATLKAISGNKIGYTILNIEGASNVVIDGGNIIGERDTHIGTTGEFGFGISVISCENITIKNVNISNCWGDGLFLGYRTSGAYKQNKNIYIDNVVCFNNRRQGMSIVDGKDIYITNSEFSNTNGTAPQSGIDIEPDGIDSLFTCENIIIDGCTFKNNIGMGVVAGGESFINRLKVINCTFIDNAYGVLISNVTRSNEVVIANNIVSNATLKTAGISVNVPLGIISENIIISNNVINNANLAIYLSGDGTLNNMSVIGNTLKTCTLGVTAYSALTNCKITNNSVIDATETGIVFSNTDSSNCTISENIINGLGALYALKIHGSNLIINNNNISNTDGSGIYLDNLTSSQIIGNRINNVGQTGVNKAGIFVQGTVSDCYIVSNFIRGGNENVAFGIYAAASNEIVSVFSKNNIRSVFTSSALTLNGLHIDDSNFI